MITVIKTYKRYFLELGAWKQFEHDIFQLTTATQHSHRWYSIGWDWFRRTIVSSSASRINANGCQARSTGQLQHSQPYRAASESRMDVKPSREKVLTTRTASQTRMNFLLNGCRRGRIHRGSSPPNRCPGRTCFPHRKDDRRGLSSFCSRSFAPTVLQGMRAKRQRTKWHQDIVALTCRNDRKPSMAEFRTTRNSS